MTPSELRGEVIALLNALPHVASVAEEGDLLLQVTSKDGTKTAMGLDNLLRGINQTPSSKAALLDAALKTISSGFVDPANWPGVSRQQFLAAVMPTIKSTAFVNEVARFADQAGAVNQRPPISKEVAGDVVAIAALDLPNAFQMLHRGCGKAFGLTDEEIFEHAIKNLTNKVDSLKLIAAGPLRIFDFHTDYNASLLLVDAVWTAVAPDAEEDVVVAVPARDALIFASRMDAAAVGELRKIATSPDHAYPITSMLLRRQGKGWVVLE